MPTKKFGKLNNRNAMKNIELVQHNPTAESIVQILCKKTQNNDPLFFRVLVAYHLSKVASTMRCSIRTHDRGVIPVNMYAINLASSGHGKGHSTNIIEEQVINQFKERFLESTFELVSEINLSKLAVKRALKKNSDEATELEAVTREFKALGPLMFAFDSGTTPALKQMRHKLLMANAGSMNLEIDEIGSNLLGNVEVLTTYLELFDVGKVKQKLVKNTADNSRNEEIDGKTPTNMLLFGTPSKLFNGAKVEEEFFTMLETGYARRSIFGLSKASTRKQELTREQVYDMLTDTSSEAVLVDISDRLGELSDITHFEKQLTMSKDVSLLLIDYKMHCEALAEKLPEHEEIRKAELSHRYFKALKLAGAYSFIDADFEIKEETLYSAIKLVEESGEAFTRMLTRDRNYVKLANYLADVNREVTHVDLIEDLPFYRGSASQRAELLTLAIAHGYKHHIIIKKLFTDGIEFLKGESLKSTDLSKVKFAFSSDVASGYVPQEQPFSKLHRLTQQPNLHWTSHHLLDEYRNESNAIPGFNLIVLDVENSVTMDMAQMLLKDYVFHMHTTARHTPQAHRFRIVMPLSHNLRMDAAEFKEFMENIYEWLPFKVDEQTNQRARKWATCPGDFVYNDGQLLDVYQFIPKTTKNDERKKIITDLQSLTNMERWFVQNTGTGNRSNQLIKYALMLVDSGMDINQVEFNVLRLNDKLQDKMDESEIHATILLSAAKHALQRDAANHP